MFSSNQITIVFTFILFILLINIFVVDCNKHVKENWINYQQLPYCNIKSGAGDKGITPLVFYEYPIYRQPYNYPVCHLIDYPEPHCRTNSL